MIKIVTDTTCDLPPDWFSQYQITRIPINIQFGLETFKEGVTIDATSFYGRIERISALPTTSQPSVGEFCELYEYLASDGSDVLSIHVTSKLSGTWQAANMAAQRLEDRLNISVVDSHTGSVGLGFMVREAALLARAGLAVNEIVGRLEARRSQIDVFILLKDLHYARMSGRVGRLREMLASLLNIKPIIGVYQGALVPLERVRSQKNAFARMIALARARAGETPVHLGLVHALARPEAEDLLAQLRQGLNCRDTFVADLALSLAVHFGPGTVGFATYPAETV